MSRKESKEKKTSAKNQEKNRQWSFSGSSSLHHRSSSPDPASAIASLVLASSFSPSASFSSSSSEERKKEKESEKENHVKHQVKLWNQNHYSMEEREEEREGEKEGTKLLSQDQERENQKEGGGGGEKNYNNIKTDGNISSTASSSFPHHCESNSGFEPLTQQQEPELQSTTHSSERKSEEEEEKKKEENKQQEVEEIQSLDSSNSLTVTFSSSSSSSSSARGTLSSPSLKVEKEEERERKKKEEEKNPNPNEIMMKNPFKKKESSENSVGHALANVLTGGTGTMGSVTSMDTLDPGTVGGSGTGGTSPTTSNTSAINPILAKEARTRSFLVGNLGCHDGILGCEELERFFPNGKVNIMLITWNMSGNSPPSELNDLLLPETLLYVPDIYAIAMQEMVFGEGKEIEVQLQTTIGPSHVLLHSHIHGVLGLLIFVRRDLIWFFSCPEEAAYNVRPASMNMVKTKGAVGVSFSFFGTTFLFINSHLPAHESRNKERRDAYEKIISSFDLPKNLKPLKPRYISSDCTARFDVCFWIGDLNFRIEKSYEETIQILEEIKSLKELQKSGCEETGKIKRILNRSSVNFGTNQNSNTYGNFQNITREKNASNTSLQGSISSSVDSTSGFVVDNVSSLPNHQCSSAIGAAIASSTTNVAKMSPRRRRRISEPGTASNSRNSESPKLSTDGHSMDNNCFECLLREDQLLKGMEDRTLFNGFQEVSEITFAPTFKYDINGDNFNVEYHRVPSYTDRILTRSKRPGHVSCIAYDSIPGIKTSDHKPVFALMECQIRPGKDTIPLNAGLFKRDVYVESLRRRAEENFGITGNHSSNCGVS